MKFKYIFSNSYETANNQTDTELVSHYYRNDYNTVKDAVLNYAKLKQYEVLNIDDEYREILLRFGRGDVIVTIFGVNSYEFSVDFKVTTNYILGLARGQKIIIDFYKNLDRSLTLKSIGAK